MRSIAAAGRAAERDAKRRQRELVGRQKEMAKLQEMERAILEVELYENRIEVFQTVHQDCSPELSWQQLLSIHEPAKPGRDETQERSAKAIATAHKPSVLDKMLRRTERKKDELNRRIELARKQDDEKFAEATRAYEAEHNDWREMREIGGRILEGNTEAFIKALTKVDPFSEISAIGSSVNFRVNNPSLVEVELEVHGEEVIPKEKKYLLKSGKLSFKDMPKSEYHGLYQDYVCSATLRIARELFALLPVKAVIVTAMAKLLNSKTGHMESQPILSVAIPRQTLETLQFESIDPSDSMSNFVHNMKFKKTQGFEAVEKIHSTGVDLIG